MIRRIVAGSRYLIVVAVAGIFIAATALLVYGALQTATLIAGLFGSPVSSKGAKALLLAAIELVDLFLLATVMYVIAAGLYELFIDDTLPLPSWLEIHNLDDLKSKLIGVVVVVLGVLFLGQVIAWDGQRDLLGYGAAIALVVAALTYFLSQQPKKPSLMTTNEWATADHALAYLARADAIPHRTEGEATLLDLVPRDVQRMLDLGTGDGRLLALLKIDRPQAQALALDFSPTMLQAARERFAGDPTITIVEHNMDLPLPDLGRFDAIVSSFAIHHCTHERKHALYEEIFAALTPGGDHCGRKIERQRLGLWPVDL